MRTFALVLACTLLAGCGGRVIVVSGIEVYERVWYRSVETLAPRASYELGCPPEQLAYRLFQKVGRQPVQVGVMGCGRRAMYTRPVARVGGAVAVSDTWMLDGSVQ